MLKYLTKAIAVAAACFISFNANAQTDTSYYDLGRIRIKKNFAQSVTVKGEELEKFPSISLSDALTVWLSGQFTKTAGVVYVIDGDLINSVDAFSVFDIESATLIQNATTAMNGVTQQQDLVLIKTRIRKGNSGFTAAGQTNIIDIHAADNVGGKTSYYHQYYFSAYQNTDNSHFGISANYQHDASNIYNIAASSTTLRQPTLDRFKFYGYFDTKVSNTSRLNISVNYVPQRDHITTILNAYASSGYSTQITEEEQKPGMLNTKLALTSDITSKLSNKLSFNYGSVSNADEYVYSYIQTGNNYGQNVSSSGSSHNFLLRDNLQYQITKGDWNIEPSLNFSFRYAKSNFSTNYTTVGSSVVLAGTAFSWMDTKAYLLTPSLNIDYKGIFNIQGGLIASLKPYPENKKVSSFVTASVDALRFTTAADSYSWKFFASYANYGNFYDSNNYLTDPSAAQVNAPLFYTSGILIPGYNYHSFNSLQAGSLLGFLNKRLIFDYNFEKRQYVGYSLAALPTGSGYITVGTYPLITSQLNRIAVTATVLNSKKGKWTTGINGSHITNKYENFYYPYVSGPYTDNNKLWTGGWVNRLDFGQFNFGADMLYMINEANGTTNSNNSFVLQNAYIGYNIKNKAFKDLEIYANTRNLVQNTKADITDHREFYGLGFKAGF